MRRYRWWLTGFALLAVLGLVAVIVLPGTDTEPVPGPPGAGPLTIVSMGDSTLSGEGAGDYTSDTDGLNGNWCHRSRKATVHRTAVPGVTDTVNLACSGAPSAQVALGDVVQWTEPSQAQRLSEVIRDHRVSAVVVAIGANDDPQFSAVLNDCVMAWFDLARPGCSAALAETWQSRIDAMVPKVVRALMDIKKVFADAGYQPNNYRLVLQGYSAPVAVGMPENLRNLDGCPFRTEDLYWIGTEGISGLTTGLRAAAGQAGAHFLDLSRAGLGREACSGGTDPGKEWFRRLSFDPRDLTHTDRARHVFQESFHPNAAGHQQFGQCLTEFLATNHPAAACLTGADGALHAAATITAS